jgi:hypothetical protein
MFQVNFNDLVNQLTPWFFRKPKYLKYLFSLSKPLSELNNNGVPIQFFDQKNQSLYQFTLFIIRFLQVNSTTLVLQKYLNERWDSTNEGIVIVNNNQDILVKFKFNLSEQHVPNYRYNGWDSTVDYAASGEFVLANDGNVYESNTTPNLNSEPPSANWDLISTEKEYIYNRADIYPVDYTIKIPILVTNQLNYSNERFMSLVQFFNTSGRTYQGIVKETSAFLFEKT